ncbi:Alpha/Beta hydrolase protein [Earliella scabrosa]|nr:Alpha/Beta hydrolase protein [Earliella scabrosa]
MAALRTFLDSGAPPGSSDYTTLVVIHGYGFHAGNFKKFLPLAPKYNSRVILVNRRDYPGSTPFTNEEHEHLRRLASVPAGSPEAVEGTEEFMRDRARELYDYLAELVEAGLVTKPGGIVLAGWSLGAVWLSALLTHAASFPVTQVRLSEYLKRVVYYDASYICSGYQLPAELYHPLQDPSLSPAEQTDRFGPWVVSYYAHGDVRTSGVAALESRTALESPPPTITTMTAEDIADSVHSAPGEHGGTEQLLAQASIMHGTYASLHRRAFHLADAAEDWSRVEVRWLWGDHSIWESPLAAWTLERELEEARKDGRPVRKVQFVRLRGANHFAHWDLPEKTLQGILGDESEIL